MMKRFFSPTCRTIGNALFTAVWMLSVLWPADTATSPQRLSSGGLVGFGSLDQPRGDCLSAQQRTLIEQHLAAYEATSYPARPQAQTGPRPYSFYPQAGIVWQDLFVSNHVDVDPTGGAKDWDCSRYTEDGHTGHDVTIRSFREQEIGVPIFAALDGTVADAHDGEPDMNTDGKPAAANYVILDHGNSQYSWYVHLKKGSVAARVGQSVTAGTQIGLAGSSGMSTGPHLHFESRHAGAVYEPSAGLCRPGPSHWTQQPPIRRDLYVRDIALTNVEFKDYRPLPFDDLPRVGIFVVGSNRLVSFRLQLANLPPLSTWRVSFLREDETSVLEDIGTFNGNPFYRESWWLWSYNLDLNVIGPWRMALDVNNQRLIVAPFNVYASPSLVINGQPNAMSLKFDPLMPTADDAIFCRVQTSLSFEDPDYDVVWYRYQWRVNNNLIRDVISAGLSDAIPKNSARTGDRVTCTVTPIDKEMFGPGTIANVVLK